MKLKKDFIVHESDGEQILVATGQAAFAGLVRNNKTAAFIVTQLQQGATEEQIIDAVYARYDAPKEVIAADVWEVLTSLQKIGAIDEHHSEKLL